MDTIWAKGFVNIEEVPLTFFDNDFSWGGEYDLGTTNYDMRGLSRRLLWSIKKVLAQAKQNNFGKDIFYLG